jgi:hypothetical protein
MKVIEALGISKKLLSLSAKEKTAASNSTPSATLTDDLRLKAYAMTRLVSIVI